MTLENTVRTAVAGIAFVALAGCQTDAPVKSDELATDVQVLRDGLDSWKSGGTPAALEAGANPTQFTDPDWKAGAKLLDYQLHKAGGEDDGETLCNVNLKLEVKGKPVDKPVSYRVTVKPKRAVSRVTK